MDKFKPEDDLIPDPDDRQSGRSRKQDAFDNEPQLNVDDINIDMDDRRVSKSKRVREEDEDTYAADEEMAADARPSRGRKKAARQKTPVTRQYLMMGTGILVLLLLIFGIGSALKAPSTSTDTAGQPSGTEKSIDLSGADGNNSPTSEAPAVVSQSQDFSIPPISSTPTQAQNIPQPEGQQRIELQGDLGNSLTQQQSQIENAVTRSTLPMEPATVASVPGSKTTESRPERKTAVIEPVQKAPTRQAATRTESKPAPARRTEPAATTPARTTPVQPAPVVQAPAAKAPVAKAPVAQAPATQAQTKPAASPATQGNTQAIKNAPSSSYTLQLNASSNSANLNAWAKKENLQNYIVYQTSRNGQPWYVMVSGIYASKAEAERAVSSLPAGVQSNKPWTKPIRQVQSEIK
ncbi:cell division protein DamX [Klebsiella sp. BIGb0407]|uniref:cell division protein DamX n=1 Tax=Klebsiella sp. BIGb0407 TaxID=2940603 RepID=UPI00216A9551|nr:cell division protein DamX [Klebsiella sp. BIGb0407]MCS3432864.1 DamX protein [Klebsiella sp. BIGb0407]